MDNDLQEMLYLNARISTNARIIEELKAAADALIVANQMMDDRVQQLSRKIRGDNNGKID